MRDRITRALQHVCLWILVLSGAVSAQDVGRSDVGRSEGVFVSWPAVTVCVAIVGMVGTLLGLLRAADIKRIDEALAGLARALERVESKLDS